MSNVTLIKISGPDQTGITQAATSILSDYAVNILDIGQAVIHNNLALGILAEMPDSIDIAACFFRLKEALEKLGMSIEFDAVGGDDYQHWISEQGKPRHILTLLVRRVSAEHINAVTSLAAQYGLNIDKITRLSGRVPLNADEQSKACVEFSMRGELNDQIKVRRALLELTNTLDMDIAYQEDDMFRRNRRLVVFDMDSTLIEAEVIDELAKVAGVGSEVSVITELAMQGEIDFDESFRRRVALLSGINESALQQIADTLKLTEGAETLISTLKRLGYKTAILSGGFSYFANQLRDKLGFDYAYANQLDIQDGMVTGEVVGDIINGERKAKLLKDIAQRENIALEQVIAIGDGANDLPMLSVAGLGIAFRAKPIVKASARQSISTLGLDSIIYLLGISDRERIAASYHKKH
ncbi:MAG: phosphoserine phosphatase SerB [Cellvibrionales bacterium]|nr:phosphoserine phosphatase SerB [Cellvibrionales bacterium]|tara:strand:- start:15880 stop:17112 length:1233 start_codon:yes stop_codon:yes gene_type:complete